MKKINIENFDQTYYFFSERPELINPDAFVLFQFYDTYFFQNVLEACEVKWSKRMTLCAGTCKHSSYNSCTITLSESLLQFRNSNELKETLLHEMIHAFLFLTNPKACQEEGGHGKEFKSLMNFINGVTGLKITVYHSFSDEVELFRKHIWKCNGPCGNQPPFYGICKRQVNRPPQKSDPWFEDHKKKCGGEFIKIDGPEFGEDGKVKQSTKEINKKTKKIEKSKSEDSQNKNVSALKKSRKGQENSKEDKLQSLIDKFIITSPNQNEQNSKAIFDQQKQQINNQDDQDLQDAILLSLQDYSTSIYDFESFKFQKQQNNGNIRHNNNEANKKINNNSNNNLIKSNNSMKSQNNFEVMSQQPKLENKNFNNLLNSIESEDSQIIEYQNKQNIQQKRDMVQKQNQQNMIDKYNSQKIQTNSNQQELQQSQKPSYNQISLQNQNKIQQQDNLELSSSIPQQLQKEPNSIQLRDKDKEQVCQVKIQIGFTRDPNYNKQEYFIYLINAQMRILDINKFLQDIFQFQESKYQFKHLISESNGRDEKIDNYPSFSLQQLNEMFILLFDFGSLKIYMKELKRFNIDKEHLNSSETFQKAIQSPLKQQHVQINQK